MAAQDYNTISQPALGVESNSLSLVVKKDQKKQQKELAHLVSILKTVEVEIASAKSGATLGGTEEGAGVAKSQAPTGSAGPSNKSIEDVLAQMAGALQLLQVEIAKYANKKASSESTISEAERQIAQDNLNNAIKTLKKLEHEVKKEKTIDFWMKFGEVLAGVVLTIVAAVLVQPELLIAAVLCFASAAGLMSKASDLVAEGLEKMGVSPELAKILGGIIVTVLVIILTAGAASIAGVETGAAAVADDAVDATETATTTADAATSATGNAADEAATTSNNVLSKLTKAARLLKKANFFRKFSARTNLMIMAGSQSATQTKVINNIVGAIAEDIAKATGDKKNAEKVKQEAEMIAGIIVALMSLVATAGSASSLAGGANAATNAAEEASQDVSIARRVLTGLRELGLSSTGQRLLMGINGLSQLEIAGTGIGAGIYEIKQGLGEIALSKYQADTILNNIAIGMNNNEMRNSQQFIAGREKQFKTSDREQAKMMAGEAAFAQLLDTPMV